MVNTQFINQAFSQQSGSCVLASYAVVTNYFQNHRTIQEVFDEYCEFFRIPYISHLDSERSSGNHLNDICQRILSWRGYQMTDYIHNHANHYFFTTNRRFFSASVFALTPLTKAQYDGLINSLRVNESLANILTAVPTGGYHSRTLGIDQNEALFIHDTSPIATPKITINPTLDQNDILECIIYRRI